MYIFILSYKNIYGLEKIALPKKMELKNKGVVGLVSIGEREECCIDILPMQKNELPFKDGEDVVIVVEE